MAAVRFRLLLLRLYYRPGDHGTYLSLVFRDEAARRAQTEPPQHLAPGTALAAYLRCVGLPRRYLATPSPSLLHCASGLTHEVPGGNEATKGTSQRADHSFASFAATSPGSAQRIERAQRPARCSARLHSASRADRSVRAASTAAADPRGHLHGHSLPPQPSGRCEPSRSGVLAARADAGEKRLSASPHAALSQRRKSGSSLGSSTFPFFPRAAGGRPASLAPPVLAPPA